jgi:two-component system, LytTR family, response regulator
MTLRAIIVDDEQRGINALKMLIDKYVTDLKIVAECSQANLAAGLIEDYKPEIVFLDIQMPGMTGFDVLDELAWKDFALIFTTAYDEYALRGLKANAVDYLLKPIDHIELSGAVFRVRKKLMRNVSDSLPRLDELRNLIISPRNRLLVRSRNGMDAVEHSAILYLESDSNYTTIHIEGNKKIEVTRPLKDFEQELENHPAFMRVHNSFMVNLNKVTRFIRTTETIIMNNGMKIPVSKRRKDEFLKWLEVV